MAIKRIFTFNGQDNYVFIPACCYAGNQFHVLKYGYTPMFRLHDAKVDMPVTITDVPRLEPDGSGKIEVNTGDAATPCIGVFSAAEKRGILVFTVQQINGKNLGLAYEQGEIRLTWPVKRDLEYRMCRTYKNETPWVDEPAEIPCKILEFPCETLAAFFRVFFENRKIMGLDDRRPEVMPFERQFQVQRDKFNAMNWNEEKEFYMIGTDRTHFQVWQPGWTGGGLSGYPLMKLGGPLEQERQMKTLHYLFSTQQESGFFPGIVDFSGKAFGDGFLVEGTENYHLIRKSADVLYILMKHFKLMGERSIEIPEEFLAGTKKLADAFVRLYRKYGQFGHFVDDKTGDIIVGGSTSGAIAPAGLAMASRFFDRAEYMEVAEAMAEHYYRTSLSRGYTTGGPGEILQGVDSESAFGLLETYVVLYEMTGDEKYLAWARENAHYCSSWVVSYNYRFPEKSEFGRHDMKTVGSVFANIQNKHSAPGICTLSGDSLYKLWQWTKDELYLEMLKDIALPLGQYISMDDDPIYDWNISPEDRDSGDPAKMEKHRMPQGFINERVNMSDWEGDDHIGGVFHGSCWSETSNLLTLAEVIPLLKNLE